MFQEYRCVLLVGGKDETKKVQFVTLIPETTICIQNLGRRVARPNYPHDDFDGGEYLFLTRLLENTVTLMIICDRYILNNINPFIASLVTAWSPSLQSLYIAGDLNPEEAEQVWQAIVHKETLTRVSWNFFGMQHSVFPSYLSAMANLKHFSVQRYNGNLTPLFRLIGPNTKKVNLWD